MIRWAISCYVAWKWSQSLWWWTEQNHNILGIIVGNVGISFNWCKPPSKIAYNMIQWFWHFLRQHRFIYVSWMNCINCMNSTELQKMSGCFSTQTRLFLLLSVLFSAQGDINHENESDNIGATKEKEIILAEFKRAQRT